MLEMMKYATENTLERSEFAEFFLGRLGRGGLSAVKEAEFNAMVSTMMFAALNVRQQKKLVELEDQLQDAKVNAATAKEQGITGTPLKLLKRDVSEIEDKVKEEQTRLMKLTSAANREAVKAHTEDPELDDDAMEGKDIQEEHVRIAEKMCYPFMAPWCTKDEVKALSGHIDRNAELTFQAGNSVFRFTGSVGYMEYRYQIYSGLKQREGVVAMDCVVESVELTGLHTVDVKWVVPFKKIHGNEFFESRGCSTFKFNYSGKIVSVVIVRKRVVVDSPNLAHPEEVDKYQLKIAAEIAKAKFRKARTALKVTRLISSQQSLMETEKAAESQLREDHPDSLMLRPELKLKFHELCRAVTPIIWHRVMLQRLRTLVNEFRRMSEKEMSTMYTRLQVLKELCRSEEQYHTGLMVIQTCIVSTLQKYFVSSKAQADTPTGLGAFFLLLDEMVIVHGQMRDLLEIAIDVHAGVGVEGDISVIFDDLSRTVCEAYPTYLNRMLAVVRAIEEARKDDKALNAVIMAAQTTVIITADGERLDPKGLGIAAHLFRPMQRLADYNALLEKAVKLTAIGSSEHHKLPSLQRSLERMQATGGLIDDALHAYKKLERLETSIVGMHHAATTPVYDEEFAVEGRIMIKEGDMEYTVYGGYGIEQIAVRIYLLSDLILLLKPVEGTEGVKQKYTLVQRILLEGIQCSKDNMSREFKLKTIGQINHKLRAKTPIVCKEWIEAIEGATLAIAEDREHHRHSDTQQGRKLLEKGIMNMSVVDKMEPPDFNPPKDQEVLIAMREHALYHNYVLRFHHEFMLRLNSVLAVKDSHNWLQIQELQVDSSGKYGCLKFKPYLKHHDWYFHCEDLGHLQEILRRRCHEKGREFRITFQETLVLTLSSTRRQNLLLTLSISLSLNIVYLFSNYYSVFIFQ